MNILITGGTGFLGSKLLEGLIFDNNIYVISRKDHEPLNHMKYIKCDLTNPKKLNELFPENIDLVIHLAGEVDIRPDGSYSDNLLENNVCATINLIKVMINKKAKNLIFSSSMTVYGIDNEIPVKENGKLEPTHFYGLTKKWAEEVIKYYSKKGLINSLILRLPGLYGGLRKTGYIYNLVKKMPNDEDITIDTKGLKFWETMYIDDVINIIKKLINVWQWEKELEIINCSYGEATDFIETAYRIKYILNSESTIGIEKPIDYKTFYMDNSKLKSMINFYGNFDKSLENYIKHYLC